MDVKIYLNLIFILASIASFIDITSLDEKYKKVLLLVLFFLCWSVTPIFSEVEPMLGTWSDRGTYARIFEATPVLTEIISEFDQLKNIHGEYGFLFLISLIKTIFPFASVHFFFSVFATISLVLNYYSIVYYTNMRLSVFLGYYSIGFVILDLFYLRTGMAVAIMLYSVRFAADNKFLKFIACWFIACSIHMLAAPSLLIYLFRKIQWTYFKSTVLICLALLLMQVKVIDIVAEIINDTRLNYYVQRTNIHAYPIDAFFKIIFAYLLLVFSIKYKKETINELSNSYRVLQNMMALTMVLTPLFQELMVLQRIVWVFDASKYFLMSAILTINWQWNKYKEATKLTVIAIIILLWLRWYRVNGLELLPF